MASRTSTLHSKLCRNYSLKEIAEIADDVMLNSSPVVSALNTFSSSRILSPPLQDELPAILKRINATANG